MKKHLLFFSATSLIAFLGLAGCSIEPNHPFDEQYYQELKNEALEKGSVPVMIKLTPTKSNFRLAVTILAPPDIPTTSAI